MTASLEKANTPQRLWHFMLNMLAFSLCYLAANSLAQQLGIIRHIALPFEASTPFLPWMIIPYLSSGIFFVWSFLRVCTSSELSVLSQRVLLCTVGASLVFVIYPLQFSLQRPAVNMPLLAGLFQFLSLLDKPYNQLPSLHVAYCVIFWQSLSPTLRHSAARLLLAACLGLVAISTLFTYQHHLLDVVTGAMLGIAAICLVRPGGNQPKVAFYYAMAAAIALQTGVLAWHSWLAAYLCFSLSLVSLAYLRRDRHFLNKQAGRHGLLTWLLYFPYLTGYRLTWHAVQYRERRRAPVLKAGDYLWIGRRLNARQARELPADCIIVDLSAELSETPSLRSAAYRHFPLLDLVPPDAGVIAAITISIRQELAAGHNVYLHCAMGYSRCILLARHTLNSTEQNIEQ
ncbi:phosphatase PAP2 family protein [Undibacterium sp.]|uniref:phosphatase PAP2 family protein n=1 Tax=Undibacterium sp. TaxID=1914977 RepID=UPI00374CAF85